MITAADVIVVGAGIAGLVVTHELTSRGKTVALVDQENGAHLGGQAFWSFGGLFLVAVRVEASQVRLPAVAATSHGIADRVFGESEQRSRSNPNGADRGC